MNLKEHLDAAEWYARNADAVYAEWRDSESPAEATIAFETAEPFRLMANMHYAAVKALAAVAAVEPLATLRRPNPTRETLGRDGQWRTEPVPEFAAQDTHVERFGPGGHWFHDDNRRVFRSAYLAARENGLSEAAAESVLRNAVLAVQYDVERRYGYVPGHSERL